MRGILTLSVLITVFVAASVSAQTSQDTPITPSEPCQAESPQAESQSDSETRTDELQDCKGVLKPPPVGDSDMAVEPPVESDMPVIKPDDLADPS